MLQDLISIYGEFVLAIMLSLGTLVLVAITDCVVANIHSFVVCNFFTRFDIQSVL